METKKTLLRIAFSGSKTNRVREIETLIKDKKYKRVVEVFGGSCCISNNFKRDNMVQEAIANDYSQYFKDFDKNIEYKEQLIKRLTDLGFVKVGVKSTLSVEQQKQLQVLVAPIMDNKKLVLYLSKNFVFSARRSSNTITLKDFIYFMNEMSTKLDREFSKHLKNVQLDSLDYKAFISKYVRAGDSTTLVVLDPPYLNSAQKQYDNNTFFGLSETIRLLNIMKELGNDFIFFNMNEKDSIELLNLFNFNYIYKTKRVTVSGKNYREDFMAYITFDKPSTRFNYCLN